MDGKNAGRQLLQFLFGGAGRLPAVSLGESDASRVMGALSQEIQKLAREAMESRMGQIEAIEANFFVAAKGGIAVNSSIRRPGVSLDSDGTLMITGRRASFTIAMPESAKCALDLDSDASMLSMLYALGQGRKVEATGWIREALPSEVLSRPECRCGFSISFAGTGARRRAFREAEQMEAAFRRASQPHTIGYVRLTHLAADARKKAQKSC